MFITLIVKDGPHAEATALRWLNGWFTEGGHEAPFAPGTLLHYAFHRDHEATPTDESTRAFLTRERAVAPGPVTECADAAYDCSPDPAPRTYVSLTDVPWTVAVPVTWPPAT